jgi:flagellin
MTSIHTNLGAAAAIDTLRDNTSRLDKEQRRISSGLRVESAPDNAAYWSISKSMKSEGKALGAVQDAIGLSQAILDTTYTAMDQIKDYFTEIRNLAVLASNEGVAATNGVLNDYTVDRKYDQSGLSKIDRQMQNLIYAMNSVVESASFNGVNLLKIPEGGPDIHDSVEFVTGFTGSQVQTTSLNLKNTVMVNMNRTADYFDTDPGSDVQGFLDGKLEFVEFDWPLTYITAGGNVGINDDIYILRTNIQKYATDNDYQTNPLSFYYDKFINSIDRRIEAITSGMAVVGSIQKSLETSQEQTKSRIDTTSKGVGRLVDTDMDNSSARLKALEAQQQLGIQALNIANSNPQNILRLYQ